jgi:hypothetical protein
VACGASALILVSVSVRSTLVVSTWCIVCSTTRRRDDHYNLQRLRFKSSAPRKKRNAMTNYLCDALVETKQVDSGADIFKVKKIYLNNSSRKMRVGSGLRTSFWDDALCTSKIHFRL